MSKFVTFHTASDEPILIRPEAVGAVMPGQIQLPNGQQLKTTLISTPFGPIAAKESVEQCEALLTEGF